MRRPSSLHRPLLALVALAAVLAGLPAAAAGGLAGATSAQMDEAAMAMDCGGSCPLMATAPASCQQPMECCVGGEAPLHPAPPATAPAAGPDLVAPAPVAVTGLAAPAAAGHPTSAAGRPPAPAGPPLYTLHSSLLN